MHRLKLYYCSNNFAKHQETIKWWKLALISTTLASRWKNIVNFITQRPKRMVYDSDAMDTYTKAKSMQHVTLLTLEVTGSFPMQISLPFTQNLVRRGELANFQREKSLQFDYFSGFTQSQSILFTRFETWSDYEWTRQVLLSRRLPKGRGWGEIRVETRVNQSNSTTTTIVRHNFNTWFVCHTRSNH